MDGRAVRIFPACFFLPKISNFQLASEAIEHRLKNDSIYSNGYAMNWWALCIVLKLIISHRTSKRVCTVIVRPIVSFKILVEGAPIPFSFIAISW